MRLTFGGGLNENTFPSEHEAAEGSINFDLQKDTHHLTPRRCFDLAGTATLAGDVRGFLQLIDRDGTETTLVQVGNSVYRWNGSSTFTSVGSVNSTSQLRDAYWPLDDLLVISDLQKLTPYSSWDGTTFANVTTDVGVPLYAKYVVVHRGRVWLFNVRTTTDTPHLMVASAFETYDSFDTTRRALDYSFTEGTEAFYMLTPDLREINGVALYRDELIMSTLEGRLYRLTGTDSTNYQWTEFYLGSEAAGFESLVSTGSDVMYLKRGGVIESVRATEEWGDRSTDDLSRWISTTVKGLSSAIAVYDEKNQKVLFFVTGKVLVLFKDILLGGALIAPGQKVPLSPWSMYVTRDTAQFTCSAARYMREPGTTNFNVYFGSSDGRIFRLNGEGEGDAGSHHVLLIRNTRYFDSETAKINFLNHITRGIVQYRRNDAVDVNITLEWGDEYNSSTATIGLTAAPADEPGVFYGGDVYYGGDFYYNQGFTFQRKISHQNCSWVGKGSGCSITIDTLTLRQYQIDHVDLL